MNTSWQSKSHGCISDVTKSSMSAPLTSALPANDMLLVPSPKTTLVWRPPSEYSIRRVAWIFGDASNDPMFIVEFSFCNQKYSHVIVCRLILLNFCLFWWTAGSWRSPRLSNWSSFCTCLGSCFVFCNTLLYCIEGNLYFEFALHLGTLPLTHKAQGKGFEVEQRQRQKGARLNPSFT